MRIPTDRFLLDAKSLERAFAELLADATHLTTIAAWATLGIPLKMAVDSGVKHDAFVGCSFCGSQPEALITLNQNAKLRIVDDIQPKGIFHPKLYLFRNRHDWIAIVGSPNFTNAAFETNMESAVIVRPTLDEVSTLKSYVRDLSTRSKPMSSTWLRRYRERYKAAQHRRSFPNEAPPTRSTIRPSPTSASSLLAYSWSSYRDSIMRAAQLGSGNGNTRRDILFDTDSSYVETLNQTTPLMHKKFSRLTHEEFRKVIGADEIMPDCGWFGRLTGGGDGVNALSKNARLRSVIDKNIPRILKSESPQMAVDSARILFESMGEFYGIAHAAPTRLLTLARPDLFFSVNSKSENRLSSLFEMPMARLKRWEGYSEALSIIHRSKWFRSSEPKKKIDSRLWRARVALLDVYAYDP